MHVYASQTEESLLEARGALTYFGLTQPVSLVEREGGVVGILGPNGAGKSTLLRALCGLLELRQGSVFTRGQLIHELTPSARAKRISYLPQAPPLSPLWTAREVVEQALIPQAHDLESAREELASLCELLELSALLDRPIRELSGGELRRVTVARTLAQRAEISLLDEPLSALDWATQEHLMRVFNQVSKRRRGLLLLSIHELNLASLYTQRALLLSGGEAIAYGPTREILTRDNVTRAYGVEPLLVPHPSAQLSPRSALLQRLPWGLHLPREEGP